MVGFNLDYFFEIFLKLLPFICVSLKIAFISLMIAINLALVLALSIEYKVKILRRIGKLHISFFRSTPFIAQLFLFYYGIAQVVPPIKKISSITAMIIVLAFNSSAYMAENIRGALKSVSKGQIEAGLSIGMSNYQTIIRIVIPQAIRVAIPGLSNCFIDLIKGSAVGFSIGVIEIMSKAQIEAASSYRYIESYIAATLIYWIVVSILSYFQKQLEVKVNQAY